MSTHSESASTQRPSNHGDPATSHSSSVVDCTKGTSISSGKSNQEIGDFTGSTPSDKPTPKPTVMCATKSITKPIPATPRPSSAIDIPLKKTMLIDIPTKKTAPIDVPTKKTTPIYIPAQPTTSKPHIRSPNKDDFVDINLEDAPEKDSFGERLNDWVSVLKLEDEWISVSKKDLGMKDRHDKETTQGSSDDDDEDAEQKPSRGKKLTASGPWNVITYAGGTWKDPKWPRTAGER